MIHERSGRPSRHGKRWINPLCLVKHLSLLIGMHRRYAGRPSPYYNESHVKLRDFVRKWIEDVSFLLFKLGQIPGLDGCIRTLPQTWKNLKSRAVFRILYTKSSEEMGLLFPWPVGVASPSSFLTTRLLRASDLKNGTVFMTSLCGMR